MTRIGMMLGLSVVLQLAAAPAWAQSVAQVLEGIGVLGTWGPNCRAPVADGNSRIVYFAGGGGTVLRRLERGPDLPPLSGNIDSARTAGPTRLMMRVRNNDVNWREYNGQAFDTVVEVGAGLMRTLSSTRLHDGHVLIADGKLTADGRAIPALTKCN